MPHFVYPVDTLSDCLHFLAIMKNAAMKFHVHTFEWTYVFSSFWWIPGSGIAGHMVTLCLTF